MFMLLSPNVNTFEIVAWAQTPFSMILQSGAISVDTFFLLSGMLLVMSTLRELERYVTGSNYLVPSLQFDRLLFLNIVAVETGTSMYH